MLAASATGLPLYTWVLLGVIVAVGEAAMVTVLLAETVVQPPALVTATEYTPAPVAA